MVIFSFNITCCCYLCCYIGIEMQYLRRKMCAHVCVCVVCVHGSSYILTYPVVILVVPHILRRLSSAVPTSCLPFYTSMIGKQREVFYQVTYVSLIRFCTFPDTLRTPSTQHFSALLFLYSLRHSPLPSISLCYLSLRALPPPPLSFFLSISLCITYCYCSCCRFAVHFWCRHFMRQGAESICCLHFFLLSPASLLLPLSLSFSSTPVPSPRRRLPRLFHANFMRCVLLQVRALRKFFLTLNP